MQTPWGPSQHSRNIGGGIICVDTAGHGGYFVPPILYGGMPDGLRLNPYGGNTWFEEDCEWAHVALAFPRYFDAKSIGYAVQSVLHYSKPGDTYHAAYLWLTQSEKGKALMAAYPKVVPAAPQLQSELFAA